MQAIFEMNSKDLFVAGEQLNIFIFSHLITEVAVVKSKNRLYPLASVRKFGRPLNLSLTSMLLPCT